MYVYYTFIVVPVGSVETQILCVCVCVCVYVYVCMYILQILVPGNPLRR